MFNDRDLYILGGGGLLAILCLIPSWPFLLKVSLALLIMVLALVIALMRVGVDNRTLEQQLYYLLKYRTRPKNYSFYGRGPLQPLAEDSSAQGRREDASIPTFSLAWDDTNIYFLVTVWLAVVGAAFTVWLKDSGDLQVAAWIRQIAYWR